MAFLIWILGLIDVLCTNYGLNLGVIQEGNPLMAHLFAINANTAIAFSLTLSGTLLACLHRLRHRCTLAGKALWGILFVKLFIVILHFGWLIRLPNLLD